MRYGLLEHRLGAAGAGHLEAAAKRQRRTSKSPGPPPAAAATQARDGPRPRGTVLTVLTPHDEVITIDPNGPGPASRQRRAQLCEHLKNKDMKAANTAAKRQKPPGTYASHTDRYRRDFVYKAQMIQQGTPEWLVFSDGNTHRLDGLPGDQEFPV